MNANKGRRWGACCWCLHGIHKERKMKLLVGFCVFVKLKENTVKEKKVCRAKHFQHYTCWCVMNWTQSHFLNQGTDSDRMLEKWSEKVCFHLCLVCQATVSHFRLVCPRRTLHSRPIVSPYLPPFPFSYEAKRCFNHKIYKFFALGWNKNWYPNKK